MKNLLLSLLLILFFQNISFSQYVDVPSRPISKVAPAQNFLKGTSEESSAHLVTPEMREHDMKFTLQRKSSKSEFTDETAAFKKEQTRRMLAGEPPLHSSENLVKGVELARPGNSQAKAFQPQIETNFQCLDDDNAWPNDNGIAISGQGMIVAVQNSQINIYNENGNIQSTNSLLGFFGNDPNLSGFLYDPQIIYDDASSRFIMVCLDGANSSTNKVLVAFSQTSNPLDGWYTYYFSVAQQIGFGLWLDYPLIGINESYLTITGNVFSDQNSFVQTAVLRMDKNSGYSGNNLSYYYWTGLTDNAGAGSFTICPINHGDEGTYNDLACLFVSTLNPGGSAYQFWYLDNTTGILDGYSIPSESYAIGADAYQGSSSMLLDAGDTRVSSAFIIFNTNNNDSHIHFTYTSAYSGSGSHNGVINARIDWTAAGNLSSSSIAYGFNQADLTHPAIAYFGNNVNNGDVLICAPYADMQTNPTSVVIGLANNNSSSEAIVLHAGNNGIVYETQDLNTCRWGDYTGIARKYNNNSPTVWVASSFGKSNGYSGTWIAEVTNGPVSIDENQTITQPIGVFPNPTSENFNMHFTMSSRTEIIIEILSANGSMVKRLYHGFSETGDYKMNFQTNDLASGLYIVAVRDANSLKLISESELVVN